MVYIFIKASLKIKIRQMIRKTLILFLFLTLKSIGQNPLVQSLLNDVKLDSLTNFVKQLSGEKSVKN
jgi:hypothetical protein